MTFDIHLVTHNSQSVKHWGPLWATSTFVFESNMGTLLKYFHGPYYVPTQIENLYCGENCQKRPRALLQVPRVQSFMKELYFKKQSTEKCEILNESGFWAFSSARK